MPKQKKENNIINKPSFFLLLANYIKWRFPNLAQANGKSLNDLFNCNIFPTVLKSETPPPTSLAAFHSLWERAQAAESLNKEGIFYTPQEIVTHMVERSLKSFKKSETILDPACGSGIFLFEALKHLTAKGHSNVLEKSIFGIDKDPESVEVCRILLSLLYLELGRPLPDLTHNIVCADTLIEDTHQSFDYVLGNPPYGLKRGGQLSEDENSTLLEKYKEFRSGKVNKYLLFMAKAYQLSKRYSSFIVPNAWLGVSAGIPIRKLFLETKSLKSITTFNKIVFKGLGVEAVIYEVDKSTPHPKIELIKASDKDHLQNARSVEIKNSYCLKDQEFRIPTNWFDGAETFIETVLNNSTPLTELGFTPYIAIQAYALKKGIPPQSAEDVKKHIYHSRKKLDDSYIPYLEGSDIDRYGVSWSGSYIKYFEGLAEYQPKERFIVPRIALREIINTPPYLIKGVYLDTPYVYNKSVLNILHKDNDCEALLALLAILNSSFATKWLTLRGRKTARSLFPKIVAADLKEFPITKNFAEKKTELASLARRRLENQCSDEEIDKVVLDLYQ